MSPMPTISTLTYARTPTLPKLYRASELMGLTFKICALDLLTGGLHPHRFVFIKGQETCYRLGELLCLRLHQIGRTSTARSVFIDGSNHFDLYNVTDWSRRAGLDAKSALQSILISRPFTCYQLANAIIEDLVRIVDNLHPKLVVVSDIFQLFNPIDIDERDALQIIYALNEAIVTICRKHSLIFVATAVEDYYNLFSKMVPHADMALQLIEKKPWIFAEILRHPTKPAGVRATFHVDEIEQKKPSTLEDYLGVRFWAEQYHHSE